MLSRYRSPSEDVRPLPSQWDFGQQLSGGRMALHNACSPSAVLLPCCWCIIFMCVCVYSCTVIALISGSLGHVHRMCVRGLQICGLSRKRAKHYTKYCSTSAVIGSLFI